ncbi:protein-export chaperone SecB [Verrucomicrobium sp. BvORR034]|uniref:protein-export chaperone SecB n=1 Tax=Verrucomicrobium sp. BvORR034 TaxID=1396418 RepID=UPI0009DE6946|nr:protein-export chaperone SecB [Verrucomicrobium sp. BvORR034]
MMKLSPIQLLEYHVIHLDVEACATFDQERPMDLDSADLEVSSETKMLDDGAEPRWAVSLTVRHEPVEGKNVPYRLLVELVGLVSAIPKTVDDALEHAIAVNGPSMLFGAAREILRDTTARGPYGPIVVPSASFFTPPPTTERLAPARKRVKSAK